MQYRELTPEEFDKAPREVPGSEVFTPDNSRILAAINDEGEVVSTWTVFVIAHAEPLWVRDDYRNHPHLLKHMNTNMKALLRSLGFREAYTVVLDNVHAKVMTKLAKWFGFEVVPGTLFKWKIKET